MSQPSHLATAPRRHPLLAILTAALLTLPSAAALADACTGVAHCFNAGPFAATVTSVNTSWNHSHRVHLVRLNVRFLNTGTTPLSLAFPWRASASLVDNYGNTYGIDWRYPQNISGIAIVAHGTVNGSFVLAPGASRIASWVFSRSPGSSAVGNVFTADFPVQELHAIPGQNRMNVGSQYALDFPQLSAGTMNATIPLGNNGNAELQETVGALLGALTRKK